MNLLRTMSRCAALAGTGTLCSCAGVQSSLDPKGSAAVLIAQSHWVMFAGATAVLVLVVGLALYAVYRDPQHKRELSARVFIIGGGVALPVIMLSALLAYGWSIMARLAPVDAADDEVVRVEVTAHQWWWEVRYPGKVAGAAVTSANELHIPVGRPVNVRLTSADVIHSFWIPRLAGKLDVVPGKERRLRLLADEAGSFRGQCAEFCGAQHARMALLVTAEAPQAFEARLARMRSVQERAVRPVPNRGRSAFVQHHCTACHAVRGLAGPATPGPDLTHLAQRAWLGAGVLPNTPQNVAIWIARSQELKPGNAMPSYAHLDEGTLGELAAFLAGEP